MAYRRPAANFHGRVCHCLLIETEQGLVLVDIGLGLGDVRAAEHAAAGARRHLAERDRYRESQWAHAPDWALYTPAGERWHGFESVRALAGVAPEILLVPLAGHTRGHAGVAVAKKKGWLLHAGDAYFHRDQIGQRRRCPVGLRVFQQAVALDNGRRRANLQRLRTLAGRREDIAIFGSHDPVALDRARVKQARAAR